LASIRGDPLPCPPGTRKPEPTIRKQKFKPLPPTLPRVLVMQIDRHLGNVVLSLPILQAFASHFNAGIDLMIDRRYRLFADQLSGLRRVIPYPAQRDDHNRKIRANARIARMMAGVTPRAYSAVIDLTGGVRSTPLSLLTLSPRRFGYLQARRSWAYSHVIDAPDRTDVDRHFIHRYAAMLRAIGRTDVPPPMPIRASDDARAAMDAELDPDRPLVVLHPAAGIAWRQWPAERFAQVARTLIDQRDARVVIVGIPGDHTLADKIIAHADRPGAIRFAARPLDQLVALLERAAVLVSNESGPTHIAAAVGSPIVTIFGPTREALWHPRSVRPDALAVLRGDTCDPGCHGRTCVADKRCLTALPADRVAEAALKMIDTARPVRHSSDEELSSGGGGTRDAAATCT
jgi:ADP-heptose:LPS heptosyltransferase